MRREAFDLVIYIGSVVVMTAAAGYLAALTVWGLSRRAADRLTAEDRTAFRRGLTLGQRRLGLAVLALVTGWSVLLIALHFAHRA